MHGGEANSRPVTPGSPLTSSLYHATSTIDDLTIALANFSRVPSPEPPIFLACCCNQDTCENTSAWLECKARLESRLTLSAEVGQALLQRHEAYVRRHERRSRRDSPHSQHGVDGRSDELLSEEAGFGVSDWIREKAILEKRLNQALVNNEVTEVSTKTILHELQEARATISRLTTHHARSVGWETRLSSAIQERDDMQQERDSESGRARMADSRLAAMKDRAAKLQAEVRKLQELLEERRLHRLESSETILQDARVRLESLHKMQMGQTALAAQTGITEVLESLVNDNEALKRDNAELQHLLMESREEIHVLQEEVEEQRANPPPRTDAGTPLRPDIYVGSVPSVMRDSPLYRFGSRSVSHERKSRRPFEPLTPETSRRPLSPTDSLAPSETKWTAFSQPQPRYASSHVSFDVEASVGDNDDPSSSEKPKTHRTLLLLTRSRGVQTDGGWPAGMLSPSPLPSYLSTSSPHDPRSESSSFSESPSSNLSIFLERVSALSARMTQADALTLTNRLKRQHLKGADIGHLSRSTVNNILSEMASLRTQYRFLLEDENVITACTRKDFRILFKLWKDAFAEMGQMRVTLNDVILDPTTAPRISEMALNPSKVEMETREKEREYTSTSAGGWMAPITKLFSPGGRSEAPGEHQGLMRSTSVRGMPRPPPRFVPKLGPALSASATTVNVEFSGSGVGRSTTSTVASLTTHESGETTEALSASQSTSSGVMGIFAGAPRSVTPDPWVVLPKGPRRVQSFMKPGDTFSHGTIRRTTNDSRGNMSGISRDVDAVIDVARPQQDDEEPDDIAPLLERTLRRRGLSDSSIHSTFTNQGEDNRPSVFSPPTVGNGMPRPDRNSVFQALSRTVQNLRMTASGTLSGVEPPVAAVSPKRSSAGERSQPIGGARVASAGLQSMLPNLSSWTAAGSILDPITGTESFMVGSHRDESFIQRTRRPGESHGHEYL